MASRAVQGKDNWFSLGGRRIDADSPSTGLLYLASFDILHINYTIYGFDASDTPVVRFNSDTSLSYSYHATSYASSISTAPATEYYSNSASVGIVLSGSTSVERNYGTIHIGCMPTVGHNVMTVQNSSYTSSYDLVGSGDYKSYTPITSIEFLGKNGSNLLAGSGFTVFGANFE
jgi:hypothetical protein